MFNMSGSRGTAKSSKECEVIILLPYIAKYALLRIVVPYFWIHVCFNPFILHNYNSL